MTFTRDSLGSQSFNILHFMPSLGSLFALCLLKADATVGPLTVMGVANDLGVVYGGMQEYTWNVANYCGHLKVMAIEME